MSASGKVLDGSDTSRCGPRLAAEALISPKRLGARGARNLHLEYSAPSRSRMGILSAGGTRRQRNASRLVHVADPNRGRVVVERAISINMVMNFTCGMMSSMVEVDRVCCGCRDGGFLQKIL